MEKELSIISVAFCCVIIAYRKGLISKEEYEVILSNYKEGRYNGWIGKD